MPHLQFAYDTIFFSRASLEELQTFKLILLVFRRLSRLKINLNKSTLFGIKIRQGIQWFKVWENCFKESSFTREVALEVS